MLGFSGNNGRSPVSSDQLAVKTSGRHLPEVFCFAILSRAAAEKLRYENQDLPGLHPSRHKDRLFYFRQHQRHIQKGMFHHLHGQAVGLGDQFR